MDSGPIDNIYEASDDITIECSDDENYKNEMRNGSWEPSPLRIVELYSKLEKEKYMDIEWKCPGRRSPSPVTKDKESPVEVSEEADLVNQITDFDFDDEPTQLKFSARRTPGQTPKGSAKKKTVTFDGIVSNIRRQKKLENDFKSDVSNS